MFFNEVKLGFVDLETTGLVAGVNEILEFGLIVYDQKTDSIVGEWQSKVKPVRLETASDYALKLNGFSKNAEAYSGDLATELNKFNDLAEGCVLVGQNTNFDIGFILHEMKKLGIKPKFNERRYLDTMILSWPYIKNQDIKDLSLFYLCEHFGISNKDAHGAMVDCQRTLALYRKLMQIYGEI